jgi:hypothetical protein
MLVFLNNTDTHTHTHTHNTKMYTQSECIFLPSSLPPDLLLSMSMFMSLSIWSVNSFPCQPTDYYWLFSNLKGRISFLCLSKHLNKFNPVRPSGLQRNFILYSLSELCSTNSHCKICLLRKAGFCGCFKLVCLGHSQVWDGLWK